MTAQQDAPAHPPPARRPPAAVPAPPAPRGPLSQAVVDALTTGPPPDPADGDHAISSDVISPAAHEAARSADPYGEDLQLALHTCFELHYRGFTGVDPGWEWNPGLLRLRGAMEETFLAALRRDVPGGADVEAALGELLTEPAGARGVTHHLRDHGERWQLLEHAALRSVYHLKEADPHAWVVPRLGPRQDRAGGRRARRVRRRPPRDDPPGPVRRPARRPWPGPLLRRLRRRRPRRCSPRSP